MGPTARPEPRPAPAAAEGEEATNVAGGAALKCAAVAIGITSLAGAVAVAIARTYLERTTYYYDSAQYRQTAVLLHRTLRDQGLRGALAEAAGLKDGLDVVLRVLLWPEMLRSRFGHLAVALPFLALFVFLTVWYVFVRTRSLLGGVLAASTLLTAGLVTGPYAGLGDYWKDSLACWLLGCAALAWLLADRLRSAAWSALAGLCLGLLVMQRTAAAIFAAPAFGVLFLVAVRERARTDGWLRSWRGVVAFASPAASLAAVVAAIQLRSLYGYYFGYGYGYGSFSLVVLTLAENAFSLGGAFLVVAPAACVLSARAIPDWRRQARDIGTAAWIAVAFTVTVVLSRGAFAPGYYACATVLGVVLLATLVPHDLPSTRRRPVVWLLVALVTTGAAYQVTRAAARASGLHTAREAGLGRRAPEDARAARSFETEVAKVLFAQPEPRAFKLIYTEAGACFWNLAYFDLDPEKALSLVESRAFFSVHDSYYRAAFGWGASAAEIVEQDVRRLEEFPGTVVVGFCEPRDVLKQRWFVPDPLVEYLDGNPLASSVALLLHERIQDTPAWRPIARLESPLGRMCAYRFEAGTAARPATGRSPPLPVAR